MKPISNRLLINLYVNGWVCRLFKRPLAITLFVTSRCNANCPFCFYKKKVEDELNLNEFNRIAQSIGKLSYLNISGGEPFLRNDLAGICRVFCDNCGVQYLNLPTNGTLPDAIKDQTEAILKKCPRTLVVIVLTVLGLESEHDKLMGINGAFKKFLESYKYLMNLRSKYKNLMINIGFTFSAYNQHSLYKTYQEISNELEPDNFIITLVRGNPKDRTSLNIDIADYERFASSLDRDGFNKSSTVFSKLILARRSLMHRLNARIYREKRYIIPCFAGNMSAVITESGGVYPCELLDMELGSLRAVDYNFMEIWNSDKAKSINRWIKRTHCFCTHECNLPINITYSLRGNLLWLHEWIKNESIISKSDF